MKGPEEAQETETVGLRFTGQVFVSRRNSVCRNSMVRRVAPSRCSLLRGVPLLFALAFLVLMFESSAARGETFLGRMCVVSDTRGTISDTGELTPQCDSRRVKRGARLVLSDLLRKNVTYRLGGHNNLKPFAGQYVVVVGALDKDGGTIQVADIFRALPTKALRAKSIYIDCDNCVRGMASAWRAAFEALTEWGRFDITPDANKADVVLLISANPYLGDYVTRDGPDKRPVKVDITYVNLVDPQNGADLWGDSRQWGAFLVARATKSLVAELRSQLEIEQNVGKN